MAHSAKLLYDICFWDGIIKAKCFGPFIPKSENVILKNTKTLFLFPPKHKRDFDWKTGDKVLQF